MTIKDEKLYIVMVGLPSQGKSTIAYRLQDIFKKNDIPTMIYNNGELRRRYAPSDTWMSEFYNPHNAEAVELRKRFAVINIQPRAGQIPLTQSPGQILQRRNLAASDIHQDYTSPGFFKY